MDILKKLLSDVNAWVFITFIVAIITSLKTIAKSAWETFMAGHKKMNEKEDRDEQIKRHEESITVLNKTVEEISKILAQQNNQIEQLLEQTANLANLLSKVNSVDDALVSGLQALLRDRLKQAHRYYTKQKEISVTGKDNIEEIFKVYHDKLGGNGVGVTLYEEIMALPTKDDDIYI